MGSFWAARFALRRRSILSVCNASGTRSITRNAATSDNLRLVAPALSTFRRRLVLRFLCQGLPFGKVVGSLLFDILLSVDALSAVELLRDRVLDSDPLHVFVEIGKTFPPTIQIKSALYTL